MNGKEEVGLCLVGDRGARLQRNKRVVVTGVDHIGAQPLLQKLAETKRHVENHLFLFNSAGSHSSRVMPAVAGIDDDAANLEAEGRTSDRSPAAVGSASRIAM